ncbi:MAG: YceI family protein [Alphaproteobacteria bacterium]|nr:YceI family protein [Alphaproteobacteria bacterium]HPF48042.1 YceI family protein [Emcibacteraceae bacterium]HRW28403.1 YceI family protein [Emcibacteraceae bacterium]
MKKLLIATFLFITPVTISGATAADYVIDAEGMHASINFRVKHIGYSWLTGRFDKFNGKFTFDENNPAASKVVVDVDVRSVNTNHAMRDKHISEAAYLNVEKNPMAHYESTSIEVTGADSGIIKGNLTLNGVTKPVNLMAKHVGGGDDPWGGFRHGFEATTTLKSKDFNYDFDYGDIILNLYVEGVRQ